MLGRLPVRARGGAPHDRDRRRRAAVHGRLCVAARARELRRVQRGEGRTAQSGAGDGEGVRRAAHPRRPCRDRRPDRRREDPQAGARLRGAEGRGGPDRPGWHCRGIRVPLSAEAQRVVVRGGRAHVAGIVVSPRIQPAEATLGAVVTRVRLAALDDAEWRAILAAFHEHAVLIFPGQHPSREEQVAFGRRFGELDPLVEKTGTVPISNRLPDGRVLEDANPIKQI
ncbi:MAG: hypothetical protein E6J87_23025, partial [Deltaproteobacteria bacterium]